MPTLLLHRPTGVVHIAQGIGVADNPEQIAEWQKRDYNNATEQEMKAWDDERAACAARNKSYDGYWVLNQRVNIDYWKPTGDWVFAGNPFDKKDRKIEVGDVIVYAMRDLTVSEMKVTKIEVKNSDTIMHGIDLHTNKKTKNSYPYRCLKVSP